MNQYPPYPPYPPSPAPPPRSNPTRRKRKRRNIRRRIITTVIISLLLFLALIFAVPYLISNLSPIENEAVQRLKNVELPDYVDVRLIRIDGRSRRGTPLDEINDIVIHYVGNPGTTAEQNRNYFNNPDSEVSSHFIVGLDGEIIQCVPLWEISSASNNRNRDTISIEVCHPDDSGKFNEATYASLVRFTAFLLDACGLDEDSIIRHYDITGKECPRYFVRNEDAWEAFKADAAALTEAETTEE